MADELLPQVLCVDDEPRVLEGMALGLRRRYAVVPATSGADALKKLAVDGPFMAIVSDMRMPGMDGATFLAQARVVAPHSVRLLLTGETEMRAAIAAVNEGRIFRFLTKPCPPDELVKALDAAHEQHRLVMAERELLEKTLKGSIAALLEVLSAISPEAFGRSMRVKRLAARIASALGIVDMWAIEVAAMLCQIGYVILPPGLMDKVVGGRALSPLEKDMVDKAPAMTKQIIATIPRLDPVREILDTYTKAFSIAAEKFPVGARVLRVALDLDQLEESGMLIEAAIKKLSASTATYDPAVLAVLHRLPAVAANAAVRPMKLADVKAGMIFGEDVKTVGGVLLACRGNEISESALARLRNFTLSKSGLKEPILILEESIDPTRVVVAVGGLGSATA